MTSLRTAVRRGFGVFEIIRVAVLSFLSGSERMCPAGCVAQRMCFVGFSLFIFPSRDTYMSPWPCTILAIVVLS